MRFSPTYCILLPAFVLLVSHREARSQNVLVQVTELDSGQPLSGAFLTLLRSDGSPVGHALSNADGEFLFEAGDPGPFSVKAEVVGKETREVSGLLLEPGETREVSLKLPVETLGLAGGQVQAEGRCRIRPDEATTAAQLWDEVRKALVVQQWAESERVLDLGLLSYSRDLDPQTLLVRSEENRAYTSISQNPIRSLPPEILARDGFVQPTETGGFDYFGPDARVLLSDVFLDTHCLQVTQSWDRPGSIGLTFEPVDRGWTPDIRGVFWLSTGNWRLQLLDYAYTWNPYEEAGGQATGRVEFEALPNGAWIIRRWWIRMPVVARGHGVQGWVRTDLEIIGYREVGGEMRDVSALDQEIIVEPSGSTLTGTVWDSTAAKPLEGAEVFLEGTEYHTTTDSAGHFELRELPEGHYSTSFRHPRLDTLNLLLEGAEVELSPGTSTEVFMTIPSFETLAASLCQDEVGSREGTLVGEVRGRGSEDAMPAVRVQVTWKPPAGSRAEDLLARRPEIFTVGDRMALETATNPAGWYMACGVPSGVDLEVVAEFRERGADTLRAHLAAGDSRRLDFHLGLPPSMITTVTAGDDVTFGEGTQGVQGRILDRMTGQPIVAAEVILRGEGEGEGVLATGTTNQRGFFRLLARHPGAYSLSVQALGYEERMVEGLGAGPGRLSVVEMSIPPQFLALEPLLVRAEPREFQLEMEGFYQRKELTGGFFITPEMIEERHSQRVTQLLQGVPGATIVQDQGGQNAVYFSSSPGLRRVEPTGRGDRSARCWPRVYVDGRLMHEGGYGVPAFIDGLSNPFDLAGVEVYPTPAEIPARFGGTRSSCGVIVMWNKEGSGSVGGSPTRSVVLSGFLP